MGGSDLSGVHVLRPPRAGWVAEPEPASGLEVSAKRTVSFADASSPDANVI